MMHKRGVGALVRRSLNVVWLPDGRMHDGCCGGRNTLFCWTAMSLNIERGSSPRRFVPFLYSWRYVFTYKYNLN